MEPLPVDLSIRNVPDEVVERQQRRAARHHRSLQGELLAIIEDAVRSEPALTPAELLAEVRRLGFRTPSNSVAICRAHRDGRRSRSPRLTTRCVQSERNC